MPLNKCSILLFLLAFIVKISQAQEVSAYTAPEPMGHAMDTAVQFFDDSDKRRTDAMLKIEALGLYAIAVKDLTASVEVKGESFKWTIHRGDSFPFFGFEGTAALMRFGDSYFSLPRGSVLTLKLADHPEQADRYAKVMDTFNAALADYKKQQAAEETNARLAQIQDQQDQIQQQQDQIIRQLQQQNAKAQQQVQQLQDIQDQQRR